MNNIGLISSLIFGGALGTISRYIISGSIFLALGKNYPYGTLIVNLLGCLLIGIFSTINLDRFGNNSKAFLIIGFCGAFTTFSTYILEIANLIKLDETLKAFSYLMLSVILGFIFLKAGIMIAENLNL